MNDGRRLRHLRAVLTAATAGPSPVIRLPLTEGPDGIIRQSDGSVLGPDQSTFVVAAVNALPELLEVAEARDSILTGDVREVRAALERLDGPTWLDMAIRSWGLS